MDNKYYEYAKGLKKNITIELKNNDPMKINICAYEVDKNGKLPFLKYLLIKEKVLYYDYFNFPLINVKMDESSEDIQKKACDYIYELITKNKLNKMIKNINVDGFYLNNGSYYLFLDLTDTKLFINDMNLNNELSLVLIDEIVNTKHTFFVPIAETVTYFFLDNKEFLFLTDENKELYEIPTVVFIKENANRLQFISTFGTLIKDKTAILGPYYYFSDSVNAMKYYLDKADEEEVIFGCKTTNIEKYGLIRFALFLGNIKVITNNINNDTDNSEIKKERLIDMRLNKTIEGLTIHISDHDGNWAKHYDSCVLGNIILDNGITVNNSPIYVVKEYNQQIPLNYITL